MWNALTITPLSVEVTPLTRSAKILFRLRPGSHEIRKGVRSPGRIGNAKWRTGNQECDSPLEPASPRGSPFHRWTTRRQLSRGGNICKAVSTRGSRRRDAPAWYAYSGFPLWRRLAPWPPPGQDHWIESRHGPGPRTIPPAAKAGGFIAADAAGSGQERRPAARGTLSLSILGRRRPWHPAHRWGRAETWGRNLIDISPN